MDIPVRNFVKPWKALLFTHLSKSIEYVPGTLLSAQKTAMTKIDLISYSHVAYILVEKTDKERINRQ